MKQTKTVMIQVCIDVDYDPESKEFIEALESYRAVIDGNGEADSMVITAALNAYKRGFRDMVEGVGYLKMRGMCEKEDMYCGIEIDSDDPMPYTELFDRKHDPDLPF